MNVRSLFLLDAIGLLVFAAGLLGQLYFVGSLDRDKLDNSVKAISAKVNAANKALVKVKDRLERKDQSNDEERPLTPQEEEALAKTAIVMSVEAFKAVGDILGSIIDEDILTPFVISAFSVLDMMFIVCGLLLIILSKLGLYQAFAALSSKVEATRSG